MRATRPTLVRPFCIPFIGVGGLALLLPAFGISVLVMFVTATHSPLSLTLCGTATLLGGSLYRLGDKVFSEFPGLVKLQR